MAACHQIETFACLPNELIAKILRYLHSPADMLSIRRINRRFRDLTDLVTSSNPTFWKTACCRDLQLSCCDSISSDKLFDYYFENFVRLPISNLEFISKEQFWRFLYITHLHLVSLTPDRLRGKKPQIVGFNLRDSGLMQVVLHGQLLIANVETSYSSQASVVISKLPEKEALFHTQSHTLRPIILQSMPGRIIFLSVISGFVNPNCERLYGPSYDACPMCDESPYCVVGDKNAKHISILYVHHVRGLEVIGVCLNNSGSVRALPDPPQWRQRFRRDADLNYEIANYNKNILQIMYRANTETIHEIFHFHGDCQGLEEDHCKVVFPNAKPWKTAFNEFSSVTIFRRNDEHPTDFVQASVDWGGRMGSGGIIDDLRRVPSSIAHTNSLHLCGQTLLLAVTRSEEITNSSTLPFTEHVLIERNLRVLNISTVKSIPLSNVCSRFVTQIASIGSLTVLGTDLGKLVVLRCGPQKLANAVHKFNLDIERLSDGGDTSTDEDELSAVVDNLILFSASTDGRPVTHIDLTLSPPFLRIAVTTRGEKLFLFHL